MEWVWVAWLLVVAASFAVFEGLAIAHKRPTLSRTVWEVSKAWPPLPWVAGVVVGFLAAHFWWVGQGCEFR